MKRVPSSLGQDSFLQDLQSKVIGLPVKVERREADWTIQFADQFFLSVETLWRLIGVTYVCITSEDDGHQFGLPAPVNAAAKVNDLLSTKTVEAIEFDARTGDLRFRFDGPLTLEIVTASSGYESWQIWQSGELFAVGGSGGLL